jgi:His/Glu/Gln/Arg/opine family amino acid ABC transporter permease subunit
MFDLKTVWDVFLAVLTVVPRTLGLAFLATILSILAGFVLAMIRAYRVPVLHQLTGIFISYMRGTPMIVQLFIMYYAFPGVVVFIAGLFHIAADPNTVSPVYSVLLTFILCLAAFQAEYIRGALLAVEFKQMEAAYSVGLTTYQALYRIVVPQAVVVALPNLFNAYMRVIKGMSLAFLVGVVDILAKAKLESALNFRYIESYVAAGLVYWVLCTALTFLYRKTENRLGRWQRSAA